MNFVGNVSSLTFKLEEIVNAAAYLLLFGENAVRSRH